MGYLPEPEHNLGLLPQVAETTISDNVSGNHETIKFMKKIARLRASDPLIRKLALNILHQYGVKSHHFVDEAVSIGQYVQKKVRYVRDPDNVEYLQDPLDLVKHIQMGTAQGDCDDMALLTATLLLSVGHQPYFRAVRYEQPYGTFNHIYVVCYERNMRSEKMRVVLDCILDSPIGTEVRHVNGEEYEV